MPRNGRPTTTELAQDLEKVLEQVAILTQQMQTLEERIRTTERRLTVQMQSVEGDIRDEITNYRLEFIDLRRALDPLTRWANPTPTP